MSQNVRYDVRVTKVPSNQVRKRLYRRKLNAEQELMLVKKSGSTVIEIPTTSNSSVEKVTLHESEREDLRLLSETNAPQRWEQKRKELIEKRKKLTSQKYKDGENPEEYLESNISNYSQIKFLFVISPEVLDADVNEELSLKAAKEGLANVDKIPREQKEKIISDHIERAHFDKKVMLCFLGKKTLFRYFSVYNKFKTYIEKMGEKCTPLNINTNDFANYLLYASKNNLKKDRTTSFTVDSLKGEVTALSSLYQFRHNKSISSSAHITQFKLAQERIKKAALLDCKQNASKYDPKESRYNHIELQRMIENFHESMSIDRIEIVSDSSWKERTQLSLDLIEPYDHTKEEIEERYNNRADPYFKKIVDRLVKKKVDSNTVNTFVSLMLGFHCFHRNVTNQHIQLGHMRVDVGTFPDVNTNLVVEALGIERVEEKVKTIKGEFNTSFMIRHKDPLKCAVLAIAMHLFLKLRNPDSIDKLNKNVFRKDKLRVLNKKIADGDFEYQSECHENVWQSNSENYEEVTEWNSYNRSIRLDDVRAYEVRAGISAEEREATHLRNTRNDWISSPLLHSNYTSAYRNIKKFFDKNGCNLSSATHAGRKSGAYFTIQKGCPRQEVCNHGGWKYKESDGETTFRYQPRSSPNVLKVLAGFEVSESYRINRSFVSVPEGLKNQIFLWAKTYLWEEDHSKTRDLLEYLATVLLQDLPFLFEKYPTHALSFIEPFNSKEFKEHAENVLKESKELADSYGENDAYKSILERIKNVEDATYQTQRKVDEIHKICKGASFWEEQSKHHLQMLDVMKTGQQRLIENFERSQEEACEEATIRLKEAFYDAFFESNKMLKLSALKIQDGQSIMRKEILPQLKKFASKFKENKSKANIGTKGKEKHTHVDEEESDEEETYFGESDDSLEANIIDDGDLEMEDYDGSEMEINEEEEELELAEEEYEIMGGRVDQGELVVDADINGEVQAAVDVLKSSGQTESSTSSIKRKKHKKKLKAKPKPVFDYSFNVPFDEFFVDWFFGAIVTDGTPMIELKTKEYKNSRHAKMLDPSLEESYKKYVRVAKVFQTLMKEELGDKADAISAMKRIARKITSHQFDGKIDGSLLSTPCKMGTFLKSFKDKTGDLNSVPKKEAFILDHLLKIKSELSGT